MKREKRSLGKGWEIMIGNGVKRKRRMVDGMRGGKIYGVFFSCGLRINGVSKRRNR